MTCENDPDNIGSDIISTKPTKLSYVAVPSIVIYIQNHNKHSCCEGLHWSGSCLVQPSWLIDLSTLNEACHDPANMVELQCVCI